MSQPQEYVGGLPPGHLLNEYQIERVLGHGGFGVTYLARDTMLQKTVAVKEYLPMEWAIRTTGNTVSVRSSADRQAFEQGLTSFLNEARVLARFSHPNLIPVYRFFQANSTAYFVMDYAEGDTLKAVIKRSGSGLAEEQIKQYLIPVLTGLEGVHKAGILHRDIKPENILVRNDGSAVLIDFGAARYAMGSKSRAITSVLTAGYAPIEQYSTSAQQGPWTDIYAMGAVMYYAIAGRKPIDAVARIHDDPHVTATMAGKDRYSPEFLAAVDWALRVRAEERPQSIADWKSALEGLQLAPEFAAPATADATVQPSRPSVTARATAIPTKPTLRTTPAPPPPPAPHGRGGIEPTVMVSRPGGPSMTVQNRVLAPVAPVAAGRAAAATAEPEAGTITLRRASVMKMGGVLAVIAIIAAGGSGWWFTRGRAPVAPSPAPVAAPPVTAPAPAATKPAPAGDETARQRQLEQQRQADVAKKQHEDELAKQKAADEAVAKKKAEDELKNKAAEEEQQRAAAEREKQRQQQLEAQRRQDEAAKQKAAEDARAREQQLEAQRREEARQKAESEAAARRKAEAEAAARKKAEEEAEMKEAEEAQKAAAPQQRPQTAAEKRQAAREAKIAEKQRRAEEKKKASEGNKGKEDEDSAVGF